MNFFDNTLHLAKRGDAKSQFLIAAEMFFAGKEHRKHNTQIVEWLEKSSEAGCLDAKSLLGMMYVHGDCVKRHLRKGFSLTKEAAESGFSEAQYNLALMYFRGIGTRRDFKKAIYWLERDREKREYRAAYLLGCMYFIGFGVDRRDKYLAASLINKAIKKGYDDEMEILKYVLDDISHEYENDYDMNEYDGDIDCVLESVDNLKFIFLT
ncbi:tetratricopeptide repeat protein [Aeromonas media]|uniref:tetratricopeptide repeat protein n=1 Tax=Aeromonas media TaxID=651 RepID=UPI003D1B3697